MQNEDFAFGVFREICCKGEQTLGKSLVGEVRSREVWFSLSVCLFNGRNNSTFVFRRGGKVDNVEEEEENC